LQKLDLFDTVLSLYLALTVWHIWKLVPTLWSRFTCMRSLHTVKGYVLMVLRR